MCADVFLLISNTFFKKMQKRLSENGFLGAGGKFLTDNSLVQVKKTANFGLLI